MSLTTFGTAGNDLIVAGSTLETLVGLQGDDTYDLTQFVAAEVVEEAGGGVDTILVQAGFTLPGEIENLALTGTLVAALAGNASANRITGNDTANSLDGGAGNDTLAGGGGDDTYAVDAAADVIVELAGGGNDSVEARVSYVLAANVENATLAVSGGTGTSLTGNLSDNQLFGNALANLLDGAAGNDLLQGATGNDTLRGGEGNDSLEGQADADQLDGGNGNDTLLGGDGNDRLLGGAGNDDLRGESGADTLEGGAGNDTYRIAGGDVLDGVVEAVGAGFDQVLIAASFASYTAPLNVEAVVVSGGTAFVLVGNALGNTLVTDGGADRLDGLAGDDALDGGAGADTMTGGAGNDTYTVDNAGDQVIELAGTGTGRDLVFVSLANYVLPFGVERAWLLAGSAARNAVGNSLDNELVGNEFGNRLEGGTGADLLEGRAGADTMLGGAGNDTYGVDAAGDAIVELAGGGLDVARVAADIAWILPDNVDVAIVTGPRAELTGNRGNNTLTGAAGDDLLDGGSGVDRLVGSGGNDSYVVDATVDVVVEAAGGGSDVVFTRTSYTMPAHVERLVALGAAGAADLTGGAGNDRLEGNGSANRLLGAGGNDTLSGGAGEDTLQGGDGNDWLDGGSGIDTMNGEGGNDTYVLTAGDAVVESTGFDLILFAGLQINLVETSVLVEDVTLVEGPNIRNAFGNALGNRLTGNSLGNLLRGDAGNDTLDGGGGNDTLNGGIGDDVFMVSEPGDLVQEGVGQGNDTVLASVTSLTLAVNVERLVFTGAGNGTFSGNDLANSLAGGAGNDLLNGLAGVDTLIGGAGNDTYVVEASGETITELAGGGTDVVTLGFAPTLYDIPVNVENATLTLGSSARVRGNAADNVITGAAGADTLEGGAGNDSLNGAGGADDLVGGAGNDTYVIGTGNGAAGGGQLAGEDRITETATGGRDLAVVSGTAGYTLPDFVEDLTATGAGGQTWGGNGLANVMDLTLSAGGEVRPGGSAADVVIVRGLASGTLTVTDADGTDHVEILLAAGSSTLALQGGADDVRLSIASGSHTAAATLAAGATVSLTGAGSLTLQGGGLGVANDYTLRDFTGAFTFNPGAAPGNADALDVVLDDVQATLASNPATVERFDLVSRGMVANSLAIGGVQQSTPGGQAAFSVTGEAPLSLTGVRDAFDVLLRGYAGSTFGLSAGTAANAQNWTVRLDGTGTTLQLAHGTDANILGFDTTGTLGGSLLELSGESTAGTLNVAGNQSLTLLGVATPTVNVSLDAAVFTAGFDAAVSFTVSAGASTLDLAGSGGNDAFALGASLDSSDRILGGGGSDTVTATLPNTTNGATLLIAPELRSVETLNLSVSTNGSLQGRYTFQGASVDEASVTLTGGASQDPDYRFDVVDGRGIWNAAGYASRFSFVAAEDADGVTVTGGSFQDTVVGSAGDDVIDLKAGAASVATGGAGTDIFRFTVTPNGVFRTDVTDFVSGIDRLELDNDVMAALGAVGALVPSLFAGNVQNGLPIFETNAILKFVPTTGDLYYDPDGFNPLDPDDADPLIIMSLDNGGQPAALAASDIFVI